MDTKTDTQKLLQDLRQVPEESRDQLVKLLPQEALVQLLKAALIELDMSQQGDGLPGDYQKHFPRSWRLTYLRQNIRSQTRMRKESKRPATSNAAKALSKNVISWRGSRTPRLP